MVKGKVRVEIMMEALELLSTVPGPRFIIGGRVLEEAMEL